VLRGGEELDQGATLCRVALPYTAKALGNRRVKVGLHAGHVTKK